MPKALAARQRNSKILPLTCSSMPRGLRGPSGQTAGNVDYKAWAEVLEVNTMGPLRVLESFIEHIAPNERRLVVTITSGMGSLADTE